MPGREKILFNQPVELRFGDQLAEFLSTRTTTKHALRERPIAKYHDLLSADEEINRRPSRLRSIAPYFASFGALDASF
jgi:hypothetical protein